MSEIWWTSPAEGENGQTILVTGREDIEKQRTSGKYNDRVTISWAYTPDAKGLPDRETSELMEKADEALRLGLKKEKGCVLTGVYTGAGLREWVLYVKGVPMFNSMLNRAWGDLPLLPVTLSAEKDPDWAEYTEMRDATFIPDSDDD